MYVWLATGPGGLMPIWILAPVVVRFSGRYIGLLVQDYKLFLSSYEEARCDFIHRSANDVAHVLATSAHFESGQGVWIHVPPPHIVFFIALS